MGMSSNSVAHAIWTSLVTGWSLMVMISALRVDVAGLIPVVVSIMHIAIHDPIIWDQSNYLFTFHGKECPLCKWALVMKCELACRSEARALARPTGLAPIYDSTKCISA